MDSNLQNKKIELIQWLSTLDDSSTIEKLIQLADNEASRFIDELNDSK